MKKLITTMVMLAILVFALSTSVQAYSMSFAGTKTEVESGETFNVTISVDEQTVLANGKLSYDSSLFTFVGATQSSMSAQAYPGEGRVNWMYTDLGSNDSELQKGTGTKTFVFTFKAADVTETKKGTFTLNDFVVTTAGDNEYDQASNTVSGTKSIDVTIKKKTEIPTDNWTIDPSKDFELSIGETKQIKTDGDVTWSTSDSKIATVDKDGNVKGIGKGTATITAKDKDGNTKSVKVTVTDIKWKLDPSGDITIKLDETKKIKADEDVTWSTSNSKVVTVDKDGNIKGVGVGTATITATDKFGNKRTIKVTVVSKTAGTKDNTTTPDKKLPQTGEDFTRFACLAIAGIVLATGLVFKKKAKNLNKLFVILPLVAALSISGAVNAIKLVDDTKMKAGVFEKGDLLDNEAVVAVSPCKDFKTENSLNVATLNEIFNKSGFSVSEFANKWETVPEDTELIMYKNGIFIMDHYTVASEIRGKYEIHENNIEFFSETGEKWNGQYITEESGRKILKVILDGEETTFYSVDDKDENKTISTGTVIEAYRALGTGATSLIIETQNYTVLLYGDANGDGKICNSLDVNVIRQDYVFNNKAEGVYKKAADLYADDVLNVRDVQRMVKKYLGKLDGSLVTPFPGEKNIVLNPSEDITLKVGDTSTITAKDEDGKDIAVKWTSSNPDVATVDQNGKITAVGPGTTTITATDENGNEKSIEVTVVDKEPVKPAFTVDVKTNGNVATVTVDVTNKAEVEKDGNILPYEYVLKKVGPNGDTEIANVKTEDREYMFENLEDGDYELVTVVKTDKGAAATMSIRFTIKNSNDGVTTDKTKAVAYAKYAKPEDGLMSDYIYFTSLQSAIDYVKNNVVKDERKHTAVIGLLKDTTESIVIDDEINNINLNLNGYTLTADKAGNTITVNSATTQLYVDNFEFNLENEKETANNKKTTGGINASGTDGDNCVYLAGKNAYFTVNDHIIFGGITTNGTAIKAAKDTTTQIRIYDTTWETGNNNAVFIDDLGNGGIQIWGGTYKGYINIIKQAGDGSITIGSDSKAISKTEPEKATPRFEAHDSIIAAPNSRINFNYGYLTQRTLNVDGFTLRKDAYLYKTTSEAYYIQLKKDQTLNEKEAVVELLPEGSLYKTVQGAINAANGNEVVKLLKDTTESVVVPETAKDLTIDLNGHTLTGKEGNDYTVKTLGNVILTNSNVCQVEAHPTGITPMSFKAADNAETVILLEGEGSLRMYSPNAGGVNTNIGTHIYLISSSNNKSFIKNTGSGDITLDPGTTISISGNVIGIDDIGTGNIYINGGKISVSGTVTDDSHAVIKKVNSGNITIGKNNDELSKSNPTLGISNAQSVILVNKDVNVNFYNGYLYSKVSKICLNTDGTVHNFDAHRTGYEETLALEGGANSEEAYYKNITEANMASVDDEVVTAGTEAVSDIVNN